MSLGERLRAAREKRGIDLEKASEDTRIRQKFLRALESDDQSALPGAVYTKGFLRSYGEYLGLEPAELVSLYETERGAPEPQERLRPIEPITRRSMVFTPSILIPVVVTIGVVLFLSYLYYQFTSFAVPPRLDLAEPPADAVVQTAEFVLKGTTAPNAKVSVTVYPGPDRYTDIRAEADGAFSVPIKLKPGPNHVEVAVLDAAGKANAANRIIRFDTAITGPQGPQLVLDQPANGATYTDGPVTVSGHVDQNVAALVINGTAVRPDADGRFSLTLTFTAGAQVVRVVARSAAGAEVQQERAVTVNYTREVVLVTIKGGDAWIVAFVDGAQDARTNKIYPDGTTLPFVGKDVRVRSGNAGVTYLNVNGQDVGVMGPVGQIVERAFAKQ